MSFRTRSVTHGKGFLRALSREKRYLTCVNFPFLSSALESLEGGEREILGGLEAAADAGANGKANRFIITIPDGNSLTNDSPPGISRSPAIGA